jgi:hypothetical protein
LGTPLPRYRMYLDESGDHVFHDEVRLQELGHRYLALVGCWFPQGAAYLSFQRALEALKQRYFPHSPDEPVVLHRKELINASRSFWRLRDQTVRAAFDADLYELITTTEFTVVGVCVDKLELKQRYPDPFHPYHLALGFLLERYCGWLNHSNRSGDLMAESRGGVEDLRLKNAYEHIWTHGDRFHSAAFFRRTLTSKEAKLKRKSENVAGLQLADLLARAIRDDILIEQRRPVDRMGAFDARLLDAVRLKYNRHLYSGRIEGYGRVLFPK